MIGTEPSGARERVRLRLTRLRPWGTCFVLATLAALVAVAPACSPDEQPDTATIPAEAGAGGAPDDASGGSSGAGGTSSDSTGTPGDGGVPGGEAGAPSTLADGVSAWIGPDGGSIELDGALVTIPPTALAAPTTLTLRKLAISPPGYELYPSVFALLPRDTRFAVPITINLPLAGNAQLGTVFSGRRGSTGYSWLPTITTDDSASVEVTLAGTFFVANGVDYVDAADVSCSAVDVLDGAVSMRREVTLLAQAADCQERPLIGLSEKDLGAVEDGESTDATVALQNSSSSAAFVVLLVDVAALKSRGEDVLGSVRGALLGLGATARIGLSVYGGTGGLAEIVAPTLDRERLAKALDALADVPAPARDPSSFEALSSTAHAVERAARAFRDRNFGGAFGGAFVLWIPGSESHESAEAQHDVLQGVVDEGVRVIAAPLGAGTGLFGPENVYAALDGAGFPRAFGAAVQRLNGYVAASYLVGFCTQKESGVHTASLRVGSGAFRFGREAAADLTGSLPFCDDANPLGSCDGRECGGFGCGACDDTTSACDAATSTCRSFCDSENWCGGVAHDNPLGYAQSCADTAKSTQCSSACEPANGLE